MLFKLNKTVLSRFYKDILVMLRGNFIAQILGVFGTIYLAKLYGEEAYGYFGFFISIVSISNIINTLQLEKCIVIAKEKSESIFWFNFALKIIPIISVLFFSILYFSSFFITIDKLNIYSIFCLIVGSIVLSFNLVHSSFFTYLKRFVIMSNSKIFITVSNLLFQIILFYYYDIFGLIIGFLITQTLVCIYFFIKNGSFLKSIKSENGKQYLKSNSEIIKYLLPSNLLNSLANNLMPILILTFFGTTEAGVYFLSLKILGIPLFLISSSVADVYFKKASELYQNNRGKLIKLTKNIVKTNFLVMFGFIVFINTICIYLLEWYFDKSWESLRTYIFILSFLMLARITFNPISSLIVVLNKTYEGLLFNGYLFLINLMAIYIGYQYKNILIAIAILTIFGAIGYLVLLRHFLKHLHYIAKEDV